MVDQQDFLNHEVSPENDDIDTHQNKKSKSKNTWLIIISVLLLLLIVISSFQVVSTYQQNQLYEQRANTYELRVEEAEKLLERQQDLIFGLMDDYNADVYNNPRVENVYHQQLVASEYTVVGLQIIAIQNTQIIQLLASLP
jgi:flagellar basal body-associated protein FliL